MPVSKVSRLGQLTYSTWVEGKDRKHIRIVQAKDHSAYRWKQFKGRWKASDWLLISLVKSKTDLLKVNCFAQAKFAD